MPSRRWRTSFVICVPSIAYHSGGIRCMASSIAASVIWAASSRATSSNIGHSTSASSQRVTS
jgi:hypothetical protein